MSLCECVKLITCNQPLLKCKRESDCSVSHYVAEYKLTTDRGAELDSCDSVFINILQERSLSEQCLADDYININLTQSYYK